ncbi:hypothetical protein [Pseudanabaena sp. ABRG5-3]|uniref:hypothetical protein n=1 Tax=Pseudanabaena sp. ABRG5-3 TaxID=685565 RepID=UPI000DC72BF3|nr:hypothetical protein [Pseudanabaena sp. ABRG5-3]BBC24475.1 hypothetical protein ABRG53_2218 [Pseudanabaena sp. ABRG5-3]
MSRAPLRPLSIGNVVSTGLVLYRSNLQTYFGIALKAYLWIILPLILLGVASGLFVVSKRYPWLLLAIALVLLILGIAKYQTNAALVSRLAYQELIGKPESEQTARQQIDSKLWRFWWVAISVGLRLFIVYIISAIVIIMIAGVLGLIFGRIFTYGTGGLLISLAVGLGIAIILSWYFARWMIAEVPLAVEGNLTADQSVNRSWDLTQNSALRIQGIALIAFLVTLPITALTNYAPQFLFASARAGSPLFWTGTGISFIFSLIGSILVLPLWQTIKAAIYYDLRTRREGLDIQLRQGNNINDENDFI